MKKFKFRFESVETLRNSQEQAALKFFAEAQMALQFQLENKMNILNQIDANLSKKESLASQASTSVESFHIQQNFINGLKQKVIQADALILKAQKNLRVAFDRFKAARQNKKIIETIKDKDFKNYKKEYLKHENNKLQDLYTMRSKIFRGEES